MKIVFASKNPHKFAEVKALLSEADSVQELLALSHFTNAPDVHEDGSTFAANADKKAVEYSSWLQGQGYHDFWALAEDAGLEVLILGGFPGVLSSRLAATDADRISIVISRLETAIKELPQQQAEEQTPSASAPPTPRAARFVSSMSLALAGEVRARAEGTVEGFITEKPRGKSGFGYDPIFYYPPYGKTFGECTIEDKRAVSHRSRALAAIMARINELENS